MAAFEPSNEVVAVLEPLSMTVSLFPIDADLPTLVGATDPGRMLEILREAFRTTNGRPFTPIQCRVEVAHYPRQHHCVLRYTLEGPRSSGEEAPELTVFGKIAADDRGAVAAVGVAELREQVRRGKGRPFTVPRSLGFVEALRLTLLEGCSKRALPSNGCRPASPPGSTSGSKWPLHAPQCRSRGLRASATGTSAHRS